MDAQGAGYIQQLPPVTVLGTLDGQGIREPLCQRGAPPAISQAALIQIGDHVQRPVKPDFHEVDIVAGRGLKNHILLNRWLVHILTELKAERMGIIRREKPDRVIPGIGRGLLGQKNFNIPHFTGRTQGRCHLLKREIRLHGPPKTDRQGIDPAENQRGGVFVLAGKVEAMATHPPRENLIPSLIQQGLPLTRDQVLLANDIFGT